MDDMRHPTGTMKSAAPADAVVGLREGRSYTTEGRARVEGLVEAGHAVALYLDVDGTLLEVALTPTSVRVPPALAGLLQSLQVDFDGAVAIITGRRIADADQLLAPFRSVAAGVHGAEVRTSLGDAIVSLSPSFDAAVTHSIAAIVDQMPGIVLEHKGSGLALHYRLAPDRQSDLLLALQALLPRHHGQFTICGGRKVIEVLPVGFSKGRALRQMAELPAFRNRTPVMIGDDVADETAFIAAHELGGVGLKVAGENFPAATADFSGPADVISWLTHLRDLSRNSMPGGVAR